MRHQKNVAGAMLFFFLSTQGSPMVLTAVAKPQSFKASTQIETPRPSSDTVATPVEEPPSTPQPTAAPTPLPTPEPTPIATPTAIPKPVATKKPVSVPKYSGSHEEWMTAAGISADDFGYVEYIIEHESGWNPSARNGAEGACGLVQALPCSKLGENWQDPVHALEWGQAYVSRYGGWAGAYSFWVNHHWY